MKLTQEHCLIPVLIIGASSHALTVSLWMLQIEEGHYIHDAVRRNCETGSINYYKDTAQVLR